ncbi:MAG TPA: L-threonylcarbamoyladenylate synthase [Candidatus Binataceae bacterium]|nr:L-threonylcarbamoyladenylate synthase [Candidatus Binataceae bacterium]
MPRSKKTNQRPARRRAGTAATLDEAIDALKAGELVVYPTETFYALGADPLSNAALAKLFGAKARDPANPVALIAADLASAFGFAREVPPVARRLAEMFWPGALTLVLPAREGLAPELIGPGGGVGVRVSPHPIACALAAGLGHPVTATSANQAGAAPARNVAEARAALGAKVKVYLEGGALAADAPSTVVEVQAHQWTVLREGAISMSQLAAALGQQVLE